MFELGKKLDSGVRAHTVNHHANYGCANVKLKLRSRSITFRSALFAA